MRAEEKGDMFVSQSLSNIVCSGSSSAINSVHFPFLVYAKREFLKFKEELISYAHTPKPSFIR